MLTANKLMPQGRGLAAVLLKRATTVQLDWDLRQKSRFDATDSAGRSLGIFLPRGTLLRGGDVLVAEDGSLVVVRAAPQAVLVVRPCPDHGTPSDLIRAAYHLGNRHVAVECQADHLKIEHDHVLAGMLRRMHLNVSDAQAAFEPEGGAYQSSSHGQQDHAAAAAPAAVHGAHEHVHHDHDGACDHHAHDGGNDHVRHAGHGHGHGHDHAHAHGHAAG